MAKRKRTSFNAEQKAEAIKIAKTSGKPVAQIARDLDLAPNTLHNWLKQDQIDAKPDPRGPLTSEERAELTQLRRDLKRVEMERDFLKKAAAFFARESS
jgi:transposase